VDEVVLVGKKFDVFGDSISAYEDHKVFVPTCRLCGYFAAEVTVDVLSWDRCAWAVHVRGNASFCEYLHV